MCVCSLFVRPAVPLQPSPARYSFLFVLLYILFLLLCILRFCPSWALVSSLLPLCLPSLRPALRSLVPRSVLRAPMALIMMLLVMMDRLEALAIHIDIRGSPTPHFSASHLRGSGCQVYALLTIIRSHLEAPPLGSHTERIQSTRVGFLGLMYL